MVWYYAPWDDLPDASDYEGTLGCADCDQRECMTRQCKHVESPAIDRSDLACYVSESDTMDMLEH